MRRQLLDNLTRLVSLETTADNPAAISQGFAFLDRQLQAIYPFTKKEYQHHQVQSVVWSTRNTLHPHLILCAHLDVVPAPAHSFRLKRKAGKLIGRGTSDMKFAIASFVHSLAQLHRRVGLANVSLAVMITSDEEKGGFNGVNHLVNDIGYRADLVILPDAGDNWRIAIAAKGGGWIKLTTTGSSAHASRPWEGNNAIDRLLEILAKFKQQHQNPTSSQFVTTTNLGVISGGTTPNQVADSASVTIDIRYTPECTVDDIISEIKSNFPAVTVEKIVDKPPFQVDPDNPYIQQWIKLLASRKPALLTGDSLFTREHTSADHHYFAAHDIPVLATKPSGGLIHSPAEWLDEKEFYLFSELLSLYLIDIHRVQPGVGA